VHRGGTYSSDRNRNERVWLQLQKNLSRDTSDAAPRYLANCQHKVFGLLKPEPVSFQLTIRP
jgi:hypothetical protein